MDKEKSYRISTKNDEGRWLTHGYIEVNKYGNLQLKMNIGEEMKDAIRDAEAKGWKKAYFSIFENEDRGAMPKREAAPVDGEPSKADDGIDDIIPF